MSLRLAIGAFILFLISIYCIAKSYDKETMKIMPFVSSLSACSECHNKSALKQRLNDPTKACYIMCRKCHKNVESHHQVGYKIRDKLSKEFRLTRRNRIACYTCHDLNVRRFDNISWRSESLFESMFRSKDRYKTYYLVMNNNDGRLCKKCH